MLQLVTELAKVSLNVRNTRKRTASGTCARRKRRKLAYGGLYCVENAGNLICDGLNYLLGHILSLLRRVLRHLSGIDFSKNIRLLGRCRCRGLLLAHKRLSI